MTTISVDCPCGKAVKVKAELAGRKIRCPYCNQVLAVPGPMLPAEAPNTAGSRWYRRPLWLVPLAACVVFAGLILAVPQTRQVVVRIVRTEAEEPAAAASDGTTPEAAAVEAEGPPPEEEAPLTSSEEGIEVLPPAAAREPGRALRKLLLVGSNPAMFPTLEDAMAAARPGDIIEIRTNRPLYVAGAEFRRKERVADAPLTIRAGRRYQPVLCYAGRFVPMLIVANADVHLEGLHFAHASALEIRGGDVRMTDCSMTNTLYGVHLWNQWQPTGPRRILLERCLLRKGDIGVQAEGPSLAVSVRNSAFVSGTHAVSLYLDEDQSVTVERSTCLMRLVALHSSKLFQRTKGIQPAVPLSLRADHCVLAAPWAGPVLVEYYIPTEYLDRTKESLLQAFRELKAGSSISKYWGYWANVNNGRKGDTFKEPLFPDLPRSVPAIRFGPRFQAIVRLVLEGGNPPQAQDMLAALQPADLALEPSGVVGELLARGEPLGPDLRRLPVPPPAALASPDQHVLYRFSPRDWKKIVAESEQFSSGLGGIDTLSPHWLGPDVDTMLFAKATRVGQWVEAKFKLGRAGRFAAHATWVKGPQCGLVKATLQGQPAGGTIDLYAEETMPLVRQNLGEVDLPAGEITLHLESAGSSPQAKKPGFWFGLTSLSLRAVEKSQAARR